MPIRHAISRSSIISIGLAVAALALAALTGPALAEEVNCANEFRSGKLYFDQGKGDASLFLKAVGKFKVAAEVCPDKWEYHARYGMALCELARYYLSTVPEPTLDSPDTSVARALELYEMAGKEFQATMDTEEGQRKKNQKFVEQNRGHYWADNYNEAIELQEDDKLKEAEFRFHVARLIQPDDIRALGSEAVVKVQLDKIGEAMTLISDGLKIDPENERLIQIKDSITLDVARKFSSEAEKEGSCEKMASALQSYDELIAKDPGNADMLFERGVAELTGSNLSCSDDAARKDLATRAAADFKGARAQVDPEGDNRQFYVDALFNEMQSLYNAEDKDAALKANLDYICMEPTDPVGWEFLTSARIGAEDQEGAVAALMMSKSLAGSEVPLTEAMDVLKDDAKAAFDAMGRPDEVYSYQESSSGNQIQTWVWLAKKKAMSFILGKKQGEVVWCQ